MANLRIEYLARDGAEPQRQSISVPDVQTALIVAQINSPQRAVELWDGEVHLARLESQQGDLSPLWRVG